MQFLNRVVGELVCMGCSEQEAAGIERVGVLIDPHILEKLEYGVALKPF